MESNSTKYIEIQDTVKFIFGDFFESIKFFTGNVERIPAYGFQGKRNGNVFDYSFQITLWDKYKEIGMLYHWLESIKGEWQVGEKQILLEKGR